ncbi:MAG: hypothetical protein QXD09_07760, partial [Candidatus Caldarchaeum sp.]
QEANDGREVRIDLWVRMEYRGSPIKNMMNLLIPSGVQPQYDRGQSFCSVCHKTYENRDRCPYCNRTIRKNQEKRNTNQQSNTSY